jgi:hypothetical protein
MQFWRHPRRPAWPEGMIAGVAALDFLYVAWEAARTGGGCLVCPWYYPWEWTNIPTRLLVASLLLHHCSLDLSWHCHGSRKPGTPN